MTIWLKMLFRVINTEKKKRKTVKRSKTKDAIKPISITSEEIDLNMDRPENYTVEGSEKEVIRAKKVKSNKQKEAKTKRGLGQEYISRKIKKTVPLKQMKARCRGDTYEKQKRQCLTITDQQRQTIFDLYHALGDLRLQREFLVKHVKCSKVKRKSTEGDSRRANTKQYFLTVEERQVQVCKVFFFSTLGTSE